MGNSKAGPIPRDIAFRLCQEYRLEYGVKLFTQCWGCVRFSGGDPEKMCFSNAIGLRGCRFVNERFDEEEATPEIQG